MSSAALRAVRDYYVSTRGVGHTQAMMIGATGYSGSLLLAAHHEQAREFMRVGIRPDRILRIADLPVALAGARKPLLIDHYALMLMIDDVLIENHLLKRDLEETQRRQGRGVRQAHKKAGKR